MKYQKVYGKTFNDCLMEMRMLYGPEATCIARNEEYTGGVMGKFFRKKQYVITVRIPEKKAKPTVNSKIKALEKLLEAREKQEAGDDDATISRFSSPVETGNDPNRSEDREVLKRLYGSMGGSDEKETAVSQTASVPAAEITEAGPKTEPASDAGIGNIPRLKKKLLSRPKEFGLPPTESITDSGVAIPGADKRKAARPEPPVTTAAADVVPPEHIEPPARTPIYQREETVKPAPASANFENMDRVRNAMLEQDMTPDFIDSFLFNLDQNLSPEQKRNRESVKTKSVDKLTDIIQADAKISGRGRQKAILIMGPTGVGKTTTLAKLAATYALQDEKSVAMITIDNYRIAATEQLKKYADIIGVPLHICRSPLEFSSVIEEEDADIILIDTSGRSPGNTEKIRELKNYTDVCTIPMEKHLVISANTRPISINRALEAYSTVGFDKIILTKLDECEFIGTFIEMADKYNRPFSYLTNGQDVPNDIMHAEPRNMAEMILNAV